MSETSKLFFAFVLALIVAVAWATAAKVRDHEFRIDALENRQ